MFSFFSPSNIFVYLNKIIEFLNSIIFIVLVVALTFALVFSPPDYVQGDAVRIMYVHVPSAWISLAIFSIMTFSYIINYIFRIKNLLVINYSIAPLGLLFTALAIITGSVWGKPTWGTWWAWDARLTSMIFLMFFYIALILSLKYLNDERIKLKATTALSIIGFINVPIIRYSVDYLNTLHQPTSLKITGSSTIHTSFLLPLILMLLVFLIYSALIFLMKYKTEIIKMKRKRLKNYD